MQTRSAQQHKVQRPARPEHGCHDTWGFSPWSSHCGSTYAPHPSRPLILLSRDGSFKFPSRPYLGLCSSHAIISAVLCRANPSNHQLSHPSRQLPVQVSLLAEKNPTTAKPHRLRGDSSFPPLPALGRYCSDTRASQRTTTVPPLRKKVYPWDDE